MPRSNAFNVNFGSFFSGFGFAELWSAPLRTMIWCTSHFLLIGIFQEFSNRMVIFYAKWGSKIKIKVWLKF
jgi:hypothetical protein